MEKHWLWPAQGRWPRDVQSDTESAEMEAMPIDLCYKPKVFQADWSNDPRGFFLLIWCYHWHRL